MAGLTRTKKYILERLWSLVRWWNVRLDRDFRIPIVLANEGEYLPRFETILSGFGRDAVLTRLKLLDRWGVVAGIVRDRDRDGLQSIQPLLASARAGRRVLVLNPHIGPPTAIPTSLVCGCARVVTLADNASVSDYVRGLRLLFGEQVSSRVSYISTEQPAQTVALRLVRKFDAGSILLWQPDEACLEVGKSTPQFATPLGVNVGAHPIGRYLIDRADDVYVAFALLADPPHEAPTIRCTRLDLRGDREANYQDALAACWSEVAAHVDEWTMLGCRQDWDLALRNQR